MDAAGLTILLKELEVDCTVALRSDRLGELSRIAEQLAGDLPGWCSELGRKVRVEQGWNV